MCTDINSFEFRDSAWEEIAKELNDIKEKRKLLQALEAKLTKKLKDLSENKNSRSQEFVFYSIKAKGTIDYSAIPELKNLDLEPYRKEDRESWYLKKITLTQRVLLD